MTKLGLYPMSDTADFCPLKLILYNVAFDSVAPSAHTLDGLIADNLTAFDTSGLKHSKILP